MLPYAHDKITVDVIDKEKSYMAYEKLIFQGITLMKKYIRLLILALIIFIAFFCAVYISNLKSYTYFKSPNKIILYENGHKKTYTRFSIKYKKILKKLNPRFHENITTPMTSIVYKKDLDTLKKNGKVLILKYNNTKTSTFKVNHENMEIRYCSIYFYLDGKYQNQAILLIDRKVSNSGPLHSLEINGLNSVEDVKKELK